MGGKQDAGRTYPLFNVEMKSEVHHRLMSMYKIIIIMEGL